MENWQSEFLQFSLFILATIWLIQRGSNESKPPKEVGLESDQAQRTGDYAPRNAPLWARSRGWRTALYSHSLLIVMTAIFFATWFAQSLTNKTVYNAELEEHGDQAVSWLHTWRHRTFGRRRSRTGSRSFSPSGRWRSSRSICVSVARRSQSPSELPTIKPVPQAKAIRPPRRFSMRRITD